MILGVDKLHSEREGGRGYRGREGEPESRVCGGRGGARQRYFVIFMYVLYIYIYIYIYI